MVVHSIEELVENLQEKIHEKDKLWYFLLQPMKECKPYSLVKRILMRLKNCWIK